MEKSNGLDSKNSLKSPKNASENKKKDLDGTKKKNFYKKNECLIKFTILVLVIIIIILTWSKPPPPLSTQFSNFFRYFHATDPQILDQNL